MPALWISRSDGKLIPLEVNHYESEAEFQALLAEHPALLSSALSEDESDERWLLIDREVAIVSDDENDRTRWRLDHLFIGPDARPILVEVKRSRDPRARREVVAQMMDYAASFGIDWTADRLKAQWQNRSRSAESADEEMDAFLDSSTFSSADELWREVDSKISARDLRLLFVADRLSPKLIRIIEYLNDQMEHTQVLGIELVRHSAGDDLTAFQPVVRGSTTKSKNKGATGERRTIEEFKAVLLQRHGAEVLHGAEALIAAAEALGAWITIGTDIRSPRLFFNFRSPSGRAYWPLAINPRPGKLALFLRFLKFHPAFEDDDRRLQLVERMETATGQSIDKDRLGGFPSAHVRALADPDHVAAIAEVLRWAKQTVDQTN